MSTASDITAPKKKQKPPKPSSTSDGLPTNGTPDLVNHPPHYGHHPSGVECIEIAEWYNFCIGNAIKYLWRADRKGAPLEDLRKAQWYINREIDRREREYGTSSDVPRT
jgi:hypothetical protein